MSFETKIENLLKNCSESLDTEFKEQLDISESNHLAKLVKSCCALYNNNGGLLVIGLKDDGKPFDAYRASAAINIDTLQSIINKYLSEKFEIILIKKEIENVECFFIFVPDGVKSPCYITSDLIVSKHKDDRVFLLKVNDYYVRTFSSNGTFSTTKILSRDDWDKLLNNCHENREANTAKILQKHITEKQFQSIASMFRESKTIQNKNDFTSVRDCLELGANRFESVSKNVSMRKHGSFQVAFEINNSLNLKIDMDLLEKLNANNPRPSGWPLWVILNNSPHEGNRPKFYDNFCEAFINDYLHIDYWKITAPNCFYLYRAFQDDTNGGISSVCDNARLKTIDYIWQVQLIADSIFTAIAFAKALNTEKGSSINFCFKWTGLRGRDASAWAHRAYSHSYIDTDISSSDTSSTCIAVPINVSKVGIASFTLEVINHLLLKFGGRFLLKVEEVNNIVSQYLSK